LRNLITLYIGDRKKLKKGVLVATCLFQVINLFSQFHSLPTSSELFKYFKQRGAPADDWLVANLQIHLEVLGSNKARAVKGKLTAERPFPPPPRAG
jgi:hypothetical protein